MAPPYDFAICIDAGHGGHDNGTTVRGFREADANLDIAGAAVDALAADVRLVLPTRVTDHFLSLEARARMANAHDAWMLSVHCNSLPLWSRWISQARGAEALVHSYASPGAALGRVVLAELRGVGMPTSSQGIVERPNLAVLKLTKRPAVLIECGYASSGADRDMLDDKAWRLRAGVAIARGVLGFLAAEVVRGHGAAAV